MRVGRTIGLAILIGSTTSAQPNYDVPHPHPMLTEVLYDVPRGAEGDANKDGERHAAGDEFVEIANPYDHPINLKGYVLSSRLSSPTEDTGKGFRFVFPDCELGAHSVALVFNGHGASIAGEVGTASAPPAAPHAGFAGALVFDARITSRTRALRNSGDFVLLSGPDGAPLDVIAWGESDPAPPASAARLAVHEGSIQGSVQRTAPDADIARHTDLDGRLFSPGEIPTP